MIRLLHLADVHLDAPCGAFGAAAGRRRAQILEAFRRLPEHAEAEKAHAVLVAGDLFDGPQPSAEAFAAARETFRRLTEAGRPVFVVPGNHDAITLHPNPWGRDLGGAHVFCEPEFGEPRTVQTEAGPLHVYGLAHDPSRPEAPLAAFRRSGAEGAHVVLLHGAVPDAPHWETSPNGLRLPPEALAGLTADYVALGDYHRFRAPDGFGRFEGASIPACYAGAFAALGFGDDGPRGFVIAEVAPGRAPRVRHVPSGAPPVVDLGEIDIGGLDATEEAVDAVADRVPEGAWFVAELAGTPGFPLDLRSVRVQLAARFPEAAFRVTDRTLHYASERLDELADEDTIVGHVVRLGRERIEAAAGEEEREVARRSLRVALGELGVR